MTEPNAVEQYLIELINRARANPAAEAARLGIDLNEGLSQEQISTAPKQPLAFDPALTDSARGHAQWMLDEDVFSHTGAGGSGPGDRMADAGYDFTGNWRWGENISWRGTIGPKEDPVQSIESQNDALFLSPAHRENILQDDFREIGAASLPGQFKEYDALMVAENFGRTGEAVFLTGVAYDDLNDNDFYTPGEGLGGITVEASLQGLDKPILLSDITGTAGGYEIAATPGTYTVTFSGGGLAAPVVQTVALGNENVKLDLIDPRDIEAPLGFRVAGASESAKLDFSALVDHVRGHSPLPDAWAETLHRGEEILKTADTDVFADDLAHCIELLGVPDHPYGADGLVGA